MAEFKEIMEDYAAICAFIDGEEAKIKVFKKTRDKIKVALMASMNTIGIDNAKTAAGHSVCRVLNNSAKVKDAEAFYDFIFESGDTSFLTKHCAADAVKAYLDEHKKLPPGIELVSAYTLRFTKAGSKPEDNDDEE